MEGKPDIDLITEIYEEDECTGGKEKSYLGDEQSENSGDFYVFYEGYMAQEHVIKSQSTF